MIITIDGPAGTGKSTVAKEVAKRLGIEYFDTGAMYRSFAWMALQQDQFSLTEDFVVSCIPLFVFEIRGTGANKQYFVGDSDVTAAIRSPEVSQAASYIAAYPQVRRALLPIQRKYAATHSVVFEGRDTGSVVFPDADKKFFLTAEAHTRAKRRYDEMLEKSPSDQISFDEVLRTLLARDEADCKRAVAPLICPDDAIVIDTTSKTVEEVVSEMIGYIH